MTKKLNKCCKDTVRELLTDLGTVMGEYPFDAELYWAFRKEWLGNDIPEYIKKTR